MKYTWRVLTIDNTKVKIKNFMLISFGNIIIPANANKLEIIVIRNNKIDADIARMFFILICF